MSNSTTTGVVGTTEFLDITRLWRAVIARKWGILGFAASITLLVALFVYSMEPMYRAQASILMETQEANLVGIEEVYRANEGARLDYLLTQYELLKARSIVEAVVRKQELHKHPVFSGTGESKGKLFDVSALLPASMQETPVTLTEEEKEERRIRKVIDAILKKLEVTPVQFSSASSRICPTNPPIPAWRPGWLTPWPESLSPAICSIECPAHWRPPTG